MEKRTSLLILLELVWWVATAVITIGVLYPIWQSTVDYPFWKPNIIAIVAAVTITRYIFLTDFTFLSKWKYFKVGLVSITLPIVFLLIQNLSDFQAYLDEEGLDHVLKNLDGSTKDSMFSYIRSQMLFFGTASIIAGILMPIKLTKSVWKNFNS